MQLNRDTIFTAFFIIVIFLGLYFFGITYSLMGKYTKEGSKIPNKEYSIKLNNKGSIRYITPEQSEKLNNNTLMLFIFFPLILVMGAFLAYKKGLLKDNSAIFIKKNNP